jgi:hypothetical protein
MLALTGITQQGRDRSLLATLRGPAILAFCLALAAAFLVAVWHGPAASRSQPPAPPAPAVQLPVAPAS